MVRRSQRLAAGKNGDNVNTDVDMNDAPPLRKTRVKTAMDIDKPNQAPLKLKAKTQAQKPKRVKPKCKKPTTIRNLFGFVKYYSYSEKETDAKCAILRTILQNCDVLGIATKNSVLQLHEHASRIVMYVSKDEVLAMYSEEDIEDHIQDIFKYPEVNALLPQPSYDGIEGIDSITAGLQKTYLQLNTMSCWAKTISRQSIS